MLPLLMSFAPFFLLLFLKLLMCLGDDETLLRLLLSVLDETLHALLLALSSLFHISGGVLAF